MSCLDTAKCRETMRRMSSILMRLRLDALHEIADDGLGDIERHGRVHQLPGQIEAVDGAFELAPALGEPIGEQLPAPRPAARRRDRSARFSCARFSRILSRSAGSIGADLGDEAALQARAHAVVEAVELTRRPGRSHHHLAAAVEQRVDDVLELLLGLLAAHELEVVDQQDVDAAELVLERHARPGS